MKAALPEPERWCDRPNGGTTAENAAGAAFRRVKEATQPSDTALARVARRLDTSTRARTNQFLLRVVLASALVIAMGGVVGAALNKWRQAAIAGRRSASSDVTTAPPATGQARRGHGRATAAAPVAVPATAPVAVPATAPTEPSDDSSIQNNPPAAPDPALPSAMPAPEDSRPVAVPPAASAPGVSARSAAPPGDPSEAALLAGAFRELRTRGDAAGALRLLDQYDRLFPTATLRTEARIARAEALIALDRRADALPLLEGIDSRGGALTRDVRITRGELLAEAGRCAEAVLDFDAVLSATVRDAAGGRALYGRASCRLRGGDVAAARIDLGHYLRLHPDAAFAPAARRIMDSPP